MSMVDQMLVKRVEGLLAEVEAISEEMVGDIDSKRKSTKVSDFTKAGEIPPPLLRRMAILQMQLKLLKGLI